MGNRDYTTWVTNITAYVPPRLPDHAPPLLALRPSCFPLPRCYCGRACAPLLLFLFCYFWCLLHPTPRSSSCYLAFIISVLAPAASSRLGGFAEARGFGEASCHGAGGIMSSQVDQKLHTGLWPCGPPPLPLLWARKASSLPLVDPTILGRCFTCMLTIPPLVVCSHGPS